MKKKMLKLKEMNEFDQFDDMKVSSCDVALHLVVGGRHTIVHMSVISIYFFFNKKKEDDDEKKKREIFF